MKAPKQKPEVRLVGMHGNGFAIMGKVIKALRKQGADKEYTDLYIKKAMDGNYDHLIQLTMEYVNVC